LDRLANLTSQYESHSKAAAFVQYAIALSIAGGSRLDAIEVFEHRWPRSKHLDTIRKAAVAAGTTNGWGAPLVPIDSLASEFLELVRPASVIGRMRGFRRVPFMVKFTRQTAGATIGWVGEYRPAPAGKLGLESETFRHSKVSGIVVLSKELARSSQPAAEGLIQRDMIAAIAQFTDEQFLDPSVAEVEDVKPASITHNAVGIPSSGSNGAAVEADLKELVGLLQGAGIQFLAPYFIMRPTTALHLATLKGANGERVFPGVNVLGGEIWGIPVLVSANAGNQITLLDAAELLLAEGGIELDATEEATIQMDSDPVDGSANMVSLYQNNLVALMATRMIRWALRTPGAAAYVSGVTY
jgi:HK97 family phage major capsid protein